MGNYLATITLTFLFSPAFAQGNDNKTLESVCSNETKQACHDQAKVEAKETLPKLPPKAVPGFAVLGGLGLLPVSKTNLVYGGWITPEPVPGDVEQQRLTIQTPLYLDAKNSVSLSLGGTSLHFGQVQTLSGTNIEVPQDLWKIELGGSYSRELEDNRFIGGRISAGSASDHPFADLGVTTIGASAYYSWSTSERSRWMLTLFFSNNNPIINYIPIPGFIYIYQTETLIGMFGFPFSSVIWMPALPWMFTLGIFGPTINAEIAYGNPQKIQVFTGYSWIQQSYILENRSDPNERLYYAEMHTPVGVRFLLTKELKSELSVGYSFDRSVYDKIQFSSASHASANFGASWYGAWNFRVEL